MERAAGARQVERLEQQIGAVAPGTVAFTHLEPREDPASYDDQALDRGQTASDVKPE